MQVLFWEDRWMVGAPSTRSHQSCKHAFFFASTTMEVGNGMQVLFWEDRWMVGAPSTRSHQSCKHASQAPSQAQDRRRRAPGQPMGAGHGTVGIHEIGQYLQLWHMIDRTTLSSPSVTASPGNGARAAPTPPNRITSPRSMARSLATHGSSPGRTGRRRASDSFTGSPTWTDAGLRTALPAAACSTPCDAPCVTRHPRLCTTFS